MTRETREIGFLESASGADTITGTGVAYYKFGVAQKTRGRFPYKAHEIGGYYQGSRGPTLYPASAKALGAISFFPINAIPLYLAMGASSTAAGVHTLTWLDTGELPEFVTRWEKRRTEHTVRKAMTANKVKAFSLQCFNMNQRSPSYPVTMGLGWDGLEISDAAYAGNHDPIYPGSASEIYKPDTNMLFKWDAAADNIEYKNEVVDLIYNYSAVNRPRENVGVYLPEAILEGPRSHQLSFTVLRAASDKSILDDYYSQNASSTGHDVRWVIYNNATDYIDITWKNCFFLDLEEKDSERDGLELWEVSMVSEDPVVTSKDSLTAATFYGE